jgi:hypothetical protein
VSRRATAVVAHAPVTPPRARARSGSYRGPRLGPDSAPSSRHPDGPTSTQALGDHRRVMSESKRPRGEHRTKHFRLLIPNQRVV